LLKKPDLKESGFFVCETYPICVRNMSDLYPKHHLGEPPNFPSP
jgi:hypothetical protein